jgi:hypothetical protein
MAFEAYRLNAADDSAWPSFEGTKMTRNRLDTFLYGDEVLFPWSENITYHVHGSPSAATFNIGQVFSVSFTNVQEGDEQDKAALSWIATQKKFYPTCRIAVARRYMPYVLDPTAASDMKFGFRQVYCVVYIPRKGGMDATAALQYAVKHVFPEFIKLKLEGATEEDMAWLKLHHAKVFSPALLNSLAYYVK